MIVPDDVLWWTALGLGLFFTYEWLNFPLTTSQGAETGPGLVSAYVRWVGFPFLAAACWLILAGFAASLNNCGSIWAACFTSPTYASTTATVNVAYGSQQFYYLFYALFWIFLVLGFVSAIVSPFLHMLRPMLSKGTEPAN